MLELAPGVYAHPRMSAGVRDRIWAVLSDWHRQLGRGSLVMTWADTAAAGALGMRSLGEPSKDVVSYEGVLLVAPNSDIDSHRRSRYSGGRLFDIQIRSAA